MLGKLLPAIFFIRSILAVQYAQYILTPSSRTIIPSKIFNVNGTVQNAAGQTSNGAGGPTSFQDVSAVTYDMGLNAAGIVTFTVDAAEGDDQYIGISFTESSLWINSNGCDATADSAIDEALWYQVTPGTYSADTNHQRGGFRYLNVYHNTTGSVSISNLSIQFTAVPHLAEDQMANYTGYFHSNDEKLNRVWYAGAYTNQLCTIDPTAGDSLVHLGQTTSKSNFTGPVTWYNNYTIANGTSVLVDGAKRDRLVWPGDIAISGPSMIVSTYDIVTIRNALDSLLLLQNTTTGQLPYAGTPFNKQLGVFSFTYHLYSLIDIADYYQYTGNLSYLQATWDQFKFGLSWSLSQIDSSGLANVASSADWLRFGMGGHNIEANSIFYCTLNRAITLANVLNDTSVLQSYITAADGIKKSANALLWDASASLYRDNETTTLHPQDGNVWAIIANVSDSSTKSQSISDALYSRWTPYGPPAIEAADAISPFISGFEIQAHILAGQPSRALDLIRLMWADFMLDDPRMTNSTFIEGYSSTGALHYAPYTNDPRISHAHGWATGPTSALTFYVAGIRIVDGGAGGQTWVMSPNPGDLESVEAGFETTLGSFAVSLAQKNGVGISSYNFSAPVGTSGMVSIPLPACAGTVTASNGVVGEKTVPVSSATGNGTARVEIQGLEGGDWVVSVACS